MNRTSIRTPSSSVHLDEVRELCKHCDVTERLHLVPPSAKSRGMYFTGIERALAGKTSLERYKALFPQRTSTLRWYPTSEFLVRLAVGGALLAGPEHVHEGMLQIGRGNAVHFSESLLGRLLFRLLDRDPKRLLKQGIASRRQSSTYGRWELACPLDREAVVTMTDEYAYIESYMLGAAQGTFEAIGLPVRVDVALRSRFTGSHVLRW